MKTRFLPSFTQISSFCAVATLAVCLPSCNFLSPEPAPSVIVPRLPESLNQWFGTIVWKTSGTIVQSGNYEPGTRIEINKIRHPSGDWAYVKPIFRSNSPWRSAPEPLFPAWGWIAGASTEGDRQAGLVAMLLEMWHRNNVPLTGFNTLRLWDQAQAQSLDSESVDRDRLIAGIVNKNLTIYDIKARGRVSCEVSLPRGNWIDARGETVHDSTGETAGSVGLSLQLGVSDLFCRDGSAFLRLQVSEGGDGRAVARWVLHQRPTL